MAVEVLARPVVSHRGSGVGVAGRDLHIAQVDAGVEHGGGKCAGAYAGEPGRSGRRPWRRGAVACGWRRGGPSVRRGC